MADDTTHSPVLEEQLLKAAIDLLVTEGHRYASAVLLSCGLRLDCSGESWMVGARESHGVDVILTGPPALYQVLRSIKGLAGRSSVGDSETATVIRDALQAAIEALLADSYLDGIHIRMATAPPFDGWREEYLAEIRGDKAPSNQAVVAKRPPAFAWNGLRFRSKTEMVLAQAFSRKGVLYFPLPAAVSEDQKREPDFLVCDRHGRWGGRVSRLL